MINFNETDLLQTFTDYCYNKNNYFSFLGAGSSKAVFEFFEESTKEKYVIKVEKSDWSEILPKRIDIEEDEGFYVFEEWSCGSSFPEDKFYHQTQKEISVYSNAAKAGIDEILCPILLDYSDIVHGYSVMPKCEKAEEHISFSRSSLYKYFTKKEKIKTTPTLVPFYDLIDLIYGYISKTEPDRKKVLKRLLSTINAARELDKKYPGIFSDLGDDNIGVYNKKIVLIDYGYGLF